MKIRTIAGAVAEIHAADSGSAITTSYLRKLVQTGAIAHVKDGNRVLVDVDIQYRHYHYRRGTS